MDNLKAEFDKEFPDHTFFRNSTLEFKDDIYFWFLAKLEEAKREQAEEIYEELYGEWELEHPKGCPVENHGGDECCIEDYEEAFAKWYQAKFLTPKSHE